MDPCKQIDGLLDRAGNSHRPLPAEAEAHLEQCGRCRALVDTFNSKETFELSDAALARLGEPILRGLKPVTPLPSAPVFLLIFLSLFIVFSAIGMYRLGAFGWAVLSDFQKLVIFSSLAASAALLSFATVRQMAPGSKHSFPPALVPIAIFVFLCVAIAGVFQYQNDPHFIRAGMGCFLAGMPFAIPAAVLFWLVLSRGVMLHPYLAGITSGLLAGLIGTSVLEVHCPILDVWHILVWHLGVGLAGGLAGLLCAVAGTAYRRWRESVDSPPQAD